MRPLVIGEEQKKSIAIVMKYAEEHVVTHDRLVRMAAGVEGPIGEDPGYSLELPVGFRVAFSYEIQNQRKARHISVSVDAVDRLPSLDAVTAIMGEFGFKEPIISLAKASADTGLTIWLEGEHAVNVLEFCDKDQNSSIH